MMEINIETVITIIDVAEGNELVHKSDHARESGPCAPEKNSAPSILRHMISEWCFTPRFCTGRGQLGLVR